MVHSRNICKQKEGKKGDQQERREEGRENERQGVKEEENGIGGKEEWFGEMSRGDINRTFTVGDDTWL